MKKYYVEVYEKNYGDELYILQSQFFDTSQEAFEWRDTIDYLADRFQADVMVAKFNEDGSYDILGAIQNCPDE